MTKLDQIISVHLGQAGVQISTAFWELMCIEHGVGPDGTQLITNDILADYASVDTLFDTGNDNNYVPRAVFIDSEPSVIDEIKTGAYRTLFNQGMMLYQGDDAANCYARGSYTIGKKMMHRIKNTTRKISESTDNLKSYFILNSTGGGTGSGLSPLLLLTLMQDYPKVSRCSLSVVPGNTHTSAVVEPYNMLLNFFAGIETCDIDFLFDNEAMYDICCKKMFMNSPTFTDINRILAMMISSITSTFRYPSTLRSTLADTLTNLIPYPRIHFPFMRFAPINHVSKSPYDQVSTKDLTKEIFTQGNQSLKVNTNKGLFISMILNYQGRVNTSEVYKAIDLEKSSNRTKFVEWSPTGIKVGISNQLPSVSPMLDISPVDQAATMLINSTSLHEFFNAQIRKYDLLYEKKSFIHWYFGEGMEDVEFFETRSEAEMIVGDLTEIQMSEEEVIDEKYQSKGRSVSIRQDSQHHDKQ